MLQHITIDNWKELFARFDGLECAILAMEHKNELQALIRGHNHGRLNEWERNRLEELRALEARHGI